MLAGGGARGAYEAGVLSVLLPELERRGERPDVIVGTSVGALNAAYLAASAHEPVATVVANALGIWRAIRWNEVLEPLVSGGELLQGLRAAGELAGVPGVRLWGLLDPRPLGSTLRRLIAFDQIHANVAAGALTAVAVAATSQASARSVVFHDGGGRIPADGQRGIDYVEARIRVEHVRASAAIPALFPAAHVTTPARARGWYLDGGTRLNTPIKPALALGAEKVIVVALNSIARPPRPLASATRPDALDGTSALLDAVLVDPLIQDVRTLATVNELVGQSRRAQPAGYRRVPYMFIAPPGGDAVGSLACQVWSERYAGLGGAIRSTDLALLGRLLGVSLGPSRGELFSYLFFAAEFAEALIALGAADAERWLATPHDDGPWRTSRLPDGSSGSRA